MILESLCRGNYSPPDMISPTDPAYWEANKKVAELMDHLKELLSPPKFKLIEDKTAQIYAAQSIECESYYKLGFATGMAIVQETQDIQEEIL